MIIPYNENPNMMGFSESLLDGLMIDDPQELLVLILAMHWPEADCSFSRPRGRRSQSVHPNNGIFLRPCTPFPDANKIFGG